MAHILLIDDDLQVRSMLKTILEGEGHNVGVAANGIEGVSQYSENRAEVVITDMIMPEKEGIETIKELMELNPEVKIIAMSGGGRVMPGDNMHLARQMGVRYAFKKPFDFDELLRAVAELAQ